MFGAFRPAGSSVSVRARDPDGRALLLSRGGARCRGGGRTHRVCMQEQRSGCRHGMTVSAVGDLHHPPVAGYGGPSGTSDRRGPIGGVIVSAALVAWGMAPGGERRHAWRMSSPHAVCVPFTPADASFTLPIQMRAVVQDRYGDPGVLHVEEVPVPHVQPDEVLIRVEGAGIDRGTWHLLTGLPLLARLESTDVSRSFGGDG